ncbi:MAG: heme lyase CcmF/NrfE family subunit [Gammaproteobacteria bacterium]|nr:heme lyase CcmF/NrfE family subunit [Gammaproteobacteria bacterium]
MTPEYAVFALILALGLACLIWLNPLLERYGLGRVSTDLRLAAGVTVLIGIAFAALIYAFLTSDFSVAYVAQNSNTALPSYFKLSAVWGAHEGSFLLWCLVACVWMLALGVTLRSGASPQLQYAVPVMAALITGFLLFMLLTSNPFARSFPFVPSEGSDLNPLLQDFALIVHPPTLYVGYVGLTVPFAIAVSALIHGKESRDFAALMQPFVLVAWAFLTLGIALGSWWAYYELGWGGWWFWDPVENASFMPWLVATALIHSLAATKLRGVFIGWTLLLAILGSGLSLLGAFLVRSGILTSVHAFALDPERGLFILLLLVASVGSALALFAWRAPRFGAFANFGVYSREFWLLINNALLVVATSVVLLGTLYPLLHEFLTDEKVSVGPPYFNAVFVPLMVLLSIAMGVGQWTAWGARALPNARQLLWIGGLALGCGLVLPLVFTGALSIAGLAATSLAGWLVFGVVEQCRTSKGARVRRVGMWVAHTGFACSLLGVGLTSQYSVERDLALSSGESVQVGDLAFEFQGVSEAAGPNYVAERGRLQVRALGSGQSFTLIPEKRRYLSGGQVMTEAAIRPALVRDVYVSLGTRIDNDRWSLRIQIKPFVRLIWLGALIMLFGGLFHAWLTRSGGRHE